MSDDGGHILTVRSHGHEDGGSCLVLECSCGQFSKRLDGCAYGSNAGVLLSDLNWYAGRHLLERSEARAS